MPVIDFADPAPDAQPNIGAFLKGAFLLDPYYIAATKHQRSGFFQLRDLVPTAFEQSEYSVSIIDIPSCMMSVATLCRSMMADS